MSDTESTIPSALHKVMADPNIERRSVGEFDFPLGSYPTEPLSPAPGYTMQFEPADGSDPSAFTGPTWGDDLEEWPDRYVYDILLPHHRLRAFSRLVFAMLPGRFFPILDVLGNDAYREIDPHIAYDLVGCEKFYDALRFFEPWLFDDGLVGFGALSIDPFFYAFIDEHKIVTLRVPPEQKERVEKILAAFDLSPVEELAGIDSVSHEHRGVLVTPEDRPELLTADEVIERLRDAWSLQLNIDPLTNLDAEGNELGPTPWQCVARCTPADDDEPESYAEILLTAENLQAVEELVADAVSKHGEKQRIWDEIDVIRADRVTQAQLDEWLGRKGQPPPAHGVHDLRWLAGGPDGVSPRPTEQA